MNVSCPACRSVFRVDPAKVPAAGVRARCSICGTLIDVVAVAPPPVHTRTQPPSAPVEVAESALRLGSAAFEAPVANTSATAVDVAPGQSAPAVEQESGDLLPVAASPAGIPGGSTAAPSIATQSTAQQPLAPQAGSPTRDVSDVRARPVNPYLNNTPELRARRLARALVSDLVAYNPQKREEGLRDGTLRQLFRDEIRKSWDEYVEQVGANVAESTPHFQDALNDVLAGGRRVF